MEKVVGQVDLETFVGRDGWCQSMEDIGKRRKSSACQLPTCNSISI